MVHCEFGQDRLAQPPLQAFELAEKPGPRRKPCLSLIRKLANQ